MNQSTGTLRVRDYGETWEYALTDLSLTVEQAPVMEFRTEVRNLERVPWVYAQSVEAQLTVDGERIHDDAWLAMSVKMTQTTTVGGQLEYQITMREMPSPSPTGDSSHA